MSSATVAYSESDVQGLVDDWLDRAFGEGQQIRSVSGWRREARQRVLQNEREHPGYIAKASAGLHARAIGRRITGWRETRGTHGLDYLPDALGTDRPPWL